MAANVTLAPAFRDVLLAAGAGALTAVLYRLLRLFTGGGKVACTVCDILVFAFAAFFYKSAVHSIFAYPTVRIFTLVPMLCGYIAAQKTLLMPIFRLENRIYRVIRRPKRKKHN